MKLYLVMTLCVEEKQKLYLNRLIAQSLINSSASWRETKVVFKFVYDYFYFLTYSVEEKQKLYLNMAKCESIYFDNGWRETKVVFK